LNQVKLSGFLVSDVTPHTLPNGGQMASALLKFAKTSSPVFVVAVAERVRQIIDFRKGDAIAITGKLALDPMTNRFVILLDVCGVWKMAADRPEFKYDNAKDDQSAAQSFYALKLHAQMARVPGR